MIRVANAPCSWGVLEFETTGRAPAPASQVLDEMAAAGYAGTELGDWGFLPTEPAALAAEVGAARALRSSARSCRSRWRVTTRIDEGVERAVRTARLLAGRRADRTPRSIVLSDDNTSVPNRTARAGRIREEDGLSADEWDGFAVARRTRGGRGPRRDRPADRLPPSLRRLRRDAAGDRGADVADGSGAARASASTPGI